MPQTIVRFEPQTNRPLDLALMVDMSGSAAIELKIEKDAAVHFFGEVVRPGDKLAVFSFTSEVNQLSNFTDNVKRFTKQYGRLNRARTWVRPYMMLSCWLGGAEASRFGPPPRRSY